ncbi:MAG: ATP-binding cassette domain-containing protein [Eubacterium sp.]|nr:ATP-binding cassette domain-containing protein [Eubacterium sp.]
MTLLKLNDIYKTYSQGGLDVPALNNINLSIDEGEYVAIMGPSGSGKSTLMNIIGCLDKPTKGNYILGDEDISLLNDRKLSDIRNREIGFVFQQFNLMPRQSALQNVELPLQYAHVPRRDRRPRCEEALIKVGLEDRMHFKATQLSGGQKQRVAIARAIVNKPRILLADEPTGALDSKSGIQVMKLFKQLHEEGSTIIMITHAQEIAEHANRIIKIFDGEITSDEPNTPVLITVPDIPADGNSQDTIDEQVQEMVHEPVHEPAQEPIRESALENPVESIDEGKIDHLQDDIPSGVQEPDEEIKNEADNEYHMKLDITARFDDIKADTSDEDEDSDIYEDDLDEEVDDSISEDVEEIVERIVQKVRSESIGQVDDKEDYKAEDDFDIEVVSNDITGGDSV